MLNIPCIEALIQAADFMLKLDECGYGTYDSPYPRKDISCITEASVPKNFKDGDCYRAAFPFFNDIDQTLKERPVMLFHTKDGVMCVPIHSFKFNDIAGERRPAKLNRYQYELADWHEDKPSTKNKAKNNLESYSDAQDTIPIELVSELKYYICSLSKNDYEETMRRVKMSWRDRHNTPWLLLKWMIRNMFDNGKLPSSKLKLQSIQDIDASKKGNIIDIASAFHYVCALRKYDHRMGWIRVYGSNGESYDHFYILFKGKSDRYVHVCRVYGSLPIYHIKKTSTMNYEKALNNEIDDALKKDYYPKNFKVEKFDARILNDENMAEWDAYINRHKNQKDLIDYLINMANDSELKPKKE